MLRDVRFIVSALTSPDFEQRSTAIACLAFLQKEPDKLRDLIFNDPVGEVRQAALWAFAFMKGQDYREITRQISEHDSDPVVCNFATRIATSTSELEIWQI